eukprot:13655249-Ditylum_brightwellii.AAC.1
MSGMTRNLLRASWNSGLERQYCGWFRGVWTRATTASNWRMEGTALCKSLCMPYLAYSSKSVAKSLSVSNGRSYSRAIVSSTLSVSS